VSRFRLELAGVGFAVLLAACVADGPLPIPSRPVTAAASPSGPIAPPASASVVAITPSAEPTVVPTPSRLPWIAERTDAVEILQDAPDIVVEEGVRRATVEQDGVRLTLEIDAVPLTAGQPMWATSTLTNTGRDVLHWMTDGCSIHVAVHGEMPLRWARGFRQVGVAGTYKTWAETADLPPHDMPVWLDFLDKRFVGIGDFGCADLTVGHELKPGDPAIERYRWDGTAGQMGPIPPGAAVLVGSFGTWWRGAAFADSRQPIEVRLPVDVESDRDPRLLSAGQAIDVALTVPAFQALLERYPQIQDWNTPNLVRFDYGRDVWLVDLLVNDGLRATVQVDPLTGAVVRVDEVP